jgi:hypothetical protein
LLLVTWEFSAFLTVIVPMIYAFMSLINIWILLKILKTTNLLDDGDIKVQEFMNEQKNIKKWYKCSVLDNIYLHGLKSSKTSRIASFIFSSILVRCNRTTYCRYSYN